MEPPRPARRNEPAKPEIILEGYAASGYWLKRLDSKGERFGMAGFATGSELLNREDLADLLRRLASNPRLIRKEHAKELTRMFEQGKGVKGVAEIVFDSKGNLIEGQHTVQGLLDDASKTEFWFRWTIIIDERAPEALGQQMKRTLGDAFRHLGVAHAVQAAKVGGALYQYDQGFYDGSGYHGSRQGKHFAKNMDAAEIIRAHPHIEQSLFPNPFRRSGTSHAGLQAAHYIIHAECPERAPAFWAMILENSNIPSKNHPVNVLLRTFRRIPTKVEHRLRPGQTMHAVFKCWNYFIQGKKEMAQSESLLGSKKELFQRPLHPDNLRPSAPMRRVQ